MTLTIPPMPIRSTFFMASGRIFDSGGYEAALEIHAHDLAAIAQREAALADELAEALEMALEGLDLYWTERFPHECGCIHDALAKHTAARQMNKEARNG